MTLGVNLSEEDTLEEVPAFVNEFNVSYPILLGNGPEVGHSLYDVIGLPTSVFVSRTGVVKRVVVGAITETQIDPYIAEIISEDE